MSTQHPQSPIGSFVFSLSALGGVLLANNASGWGETLAACAWLLVSALCVLWCLGIRDWDSFTDNMTRNISKPRKTHDPRGSKKGRTR